MLYKVLKLYELFLKNYFSSNFYDAQFGMVNFYVYSNNNNLFQLFETVKAIYKVFVIFLYLINKTFNVV